MINYIFRNFTDLVIYYEKIGFKFVNTKVEKKYIYENNLKITHLYKLWETIIVADWGRGNPFGS